MNPLFPKMKQKEADITKEIRYYLKLRGIFHWKAWQGMGSKPGVSDIIGCWKGRLLCIEVKRPKGTITPAQRDFIDAVNVSGGLAFIAYSVEDVIEHLEERRVK